MKKIRRMKYIGWKRQQGMTLMELLVAGVISLIAATGMVVVMANTLGTGSQTIQAARLTQEMRTAMQIMSRELRRANYHSTYMACFGNMGCRTTLGITAKVKEIAIVHVGTDETSSDCFYFWYDRPQTGLVTAEPVAAFRRTVDGTVGKLQMTANNTTTDFTDTDCNLSANWTDITDPDIIDVTAFDVVDAGFFETINTNGDTQEVERIGLTIWAETINDPLFLTGTPPAAVSREIQEFITVRNHTTTAVVASP